MATREQLRLRAAPAIARLACSRDFRAALAEFSDEPDHQTIIPALPDDTVGYVLDRLREAGGKAVLVMLTDDKLQFAALLPMSPARSAVASVQIDQDANAAYVQIRDGQVARTVQFSDCVNIDLDEHRVIVGIELLDLGGEHTRHG